MQEQEDAFCALMGAVSEYLKLRQQLDQLLKAGHLKMARARYAMGPGSVGQANYNSVMQATTLVDTTPDSEQTFQLAASGSTAKSPTEPSRQFSGQQQTVGEVPFEHNGADNLSDTAVNLQHSRSKDQQASTDTSQASAQQPPSEYSSNAISELAAKFGTSHADSASSGQKSAARDPLKWFGFMVSPHLRQAQTDFVKAAETSVQIASVHHRMAVCLDALTQSKQMEQT